MLHDNVDDVFNRPDLYPTSWDKREAILRILAIYLHCNHEPVDRYAEYHGEQAMEHGKHEEMMKEMGPRPPSAADVLKGVEPHPEAPGRPQHHHGSAAAGIPLDLGADIAFPFALGANIDHSNLDENRPLRIEDPYPIAQGEIAVELGLGAAFERKADDRSLFRAELLYGALPNLQLEVGSFFSTDPHEVDDPLRSGDVQIAGLYNFNQETLWLPALGLKTEVDFPTGVASRGTDVEVKGLITKSIDRLSFHGGYTFLGREARSERDGIYEVIFGASYPLGAPEHTRTTLIGDVFTEQSRGRGEDAVYGAEIGIRYQWTTQIVLDAGVGSELDGPPQRSDFLLTLGISLAF